MLISETAKRMRYLYDVNRLGHAYLLLGEHSSLLVETAKQMAHMLFCEHVTPEGEACGVCDDCLRLNSDNHMGVYWIRPDGASLKIAQMRTALSADTRKANGVKMRIIVIEDAHKLTPEATNAILKWVEEPGLNRIFLFLTVSLSAILPTLRSRCAVLRIDRRDTDAVFEMSKNPLFTLWSEVDDEADKEKSEIRFADTVSLVLELGQSMARKEVQGWHVIAERFAKMNYSPPEAYAVVDLLIAYFRDLIAVTCASPIVYFTNQTDQLKKVAQSDRVSLYARCALEIGNLRKLLASHVQMITALEAVVLRIQRELA